MKDENTCKDRLGLSTCIECASHDQLILDPSGTFFEAGSRYLDAACLSQCVTRRIINLIHEWYCLSLLPLPSVVLNL